MILARKLEEQWTAKAKHHEKLARTFGDKAVMEPSASFKRHYDEIAVEHEHKAACYWAGAARARTGDTTPVSFNPMEPVTA